MRKLTRLLAVSILVLLAIVPSTGVSAHPEYSSLPQSSANDLIEEVNGLRIANGLPAYRVSPILMRTAQSQADYMAAIGSVTHSGPGGIQLTQRLLNAGYPLAGDLSLGGFRAENITGGPNKTAAQAIQGWTRDAPHLNTMLSPNLTEIGAGVAKVGDTYYMVIDCALPTTDSLPQAYTPEPDDLPVSTSAPSDFIVPITVSTPDEDGLVYHEVQYGQSLWAIAIEYGVKIDEIRGLNNLGATTEIIQGDKLLVKQDPPPSPSIPTPVEVASSTVSGMPPSSTPFPTLTPVITGTVIATRSVKYARDASVAGIVVGIVLVTLFLAGAFTWMSSRRPA